MRAKLLAFVVTVQTLFLLTIVVINEAGLATGTVITLETVPVDPRDLLRGDYVILNYKVSDIPLSLFNVADPDSLVPGTDVYVTLSEQEGYFAVIGASLYPSPTNSGEVMMRGRVAESWRSSDSNCHVVYDLERFYVPEGQGHLPAGKVSVQVAVTPDGRGRIKQLLIDGLPFKPGEKRA